MSIIDFQNAEELSAYLAAIIESSDDAVISTDLDGVITSWNKAAEKLFGYAAGEAIGQHITIIIPPERHDEEFIILGKVRAGQRIDHFETERRTKDGSLIALSLTVSPIRNREGKIIGASKVARDIRFLKESERTSAYLAAIVDSSDDAIISKNLDGIITSWNKSAERIFGYSAIEAIGEHISLIIPADMLDEEYSIIGRVKAGQRVDHFETIRRQKSGNLINVSITVSPIRDSRGNIIGASKIARDITAQKETENALRELNMRKDEFLSNISHELRTPMNAVIGLSNILGMSASLTEKERRIVSTLKNSASDLMSLINNLLDFSRLDTGFMELEHIEFSLPEMVQKITDLLGVKAAEKKLPLNVTYGPGLNTFYISDPLRLRQIIVNLADNAIKFTGEGSVDIHINAESHDDGKTLLKIEVSDSGIGIPEDKVESIFEKFTQADASTSRKYGGSGLGLSICKAFASSLGGTITVQSREGMGTCFCVKIPVENSEKKVPLAGAQNGKKAIGKNVLLLEDYEPNAMVVTMLLDEIGYNYDVASDGAEGIRKFQQNQYDVVLMDLQMPGVDGYESTRRMRLYEQDKNRKKTPIIAMTAHVREKDKNRCLAAGMDDFIPKPFEPSLLIQKLEKVIPEKNDSDELAAV